MWTAQDVPCLQRLCSIMLLFIDRVMQFSATVGSRVDGNIIALKLKKIPAQTANYRGFIAI